jgi:hypothetical protein
MGRTIDNGEWKIENSGSCQVAPVAAMLILSYLIPAFSIINFQLV